MKRLTWTLLRLVMEAKGYSQKEMSSRLRKRFPQMKGLGKTAINDKASDGTEAPPEVAKFVTRDVETRQGYEGPAKVVRMGVAAWRGKPSPAMGKRLDALGGKLDTANGKLNSNGEKLDTLLTEVAAIRKVLKGAAHVTATVLLIVGLGSLGISSEPTNATQVPPVSDAAKGATRAPGLGAYLRAVLGGVLDLGKKAEENWVPKAPYPGQKLEKDCNPDLGEKPINGGCWVPVSERHMPPPCGKLFRHGDTCYRPVAADPNKPVGMLPDTPGQQ
jgi:hypothetical protein